jgi:hypothetical protein
MLPGLAKNNGTHCRNLRKFLLLVAPSLGFLFFGCNDSCFTFTSNPPTGTINVKAGDPKPTCMLTKANGAVRVVTHTVSLCDSCLPSARIAHVFVSLRGIEVHPSATADDAAADWQELMRQESGQPARFDLVSAAGGARLRLGELVAIPADAYRQVRMRFAPDQRKSDDSGRAPDACRGMGLNCVVLDDGRTYPLLFDGGAPELRIASASLVDGSLLIPPDSNSNLVIEINIAWALSSTEGEGRRFLPVLVGRASVERPSIERVEER